MQSGFLEDLWSDFDPHMFGISEREAALLDPQQRLLLTVALEALEDAGIPAERAAGSATGVFVGGFSLDTYVARLDSRSLHEIESHTAASLSMTMLAGRVAHSLDLRGPTVTMDTACSSSLVAAHFAYRSLAAGDCDVALVGGVNVILLPALTIATSKGKFLSPDGRCMTFDERANGYVRSEGAGMLVMKSLDRARAEGDRILAVVRMTGVNQDGRTAGISLPSAEAQASLLRQVYSSAGVRPQDIDYVEAHGTGTQAGDLVEITALDEVLRSGRAPDKRCLVGSVKSNLGHTEAAAGVTALIKASLVVHKGQVPPNLHLQNPNPKLELEQRCLSVVTELTPLPERDRPWLVGVNSFGYAGTNAHVLLEQYIETASHVTQSALPEATPDNGLGLWAIPLSARDERVLPELARRHAEFLQRAPARLPDVAHTLIERRSHLPRRAVLLASDSKDFEARLGELARGESSELIICGECREQRARVAFAFSGMGPQWWGMGQSLYRSQPLFRSAIDDCSDIFEPLSGWSLRDAMLADEAGSRVGQTFVAQPANFALQVALTRLLQSWGITPAAVIGHSNGEIAASWACGALALEDAMRACYHRARLLDTLAGQGSMLAVGLSEEEALGLIHELPSELSPQVCVAAVNSSEAVTLAGSVEALDHVRGLLEQNEIFARALKVEVAYHSHYMTPLEAELRQSLHDLVARRTPIPMYSTVTGQPLTGEELDAGYWWRNMRSPVRFAAGADKLFGDGFELALEIGAHPVLSAYLRDAAARVRSTATVIGTLSRKKPEPRALLEAAAAIYCAGGSLDWRALAPSGGHYTPLPATPWQRFDTWQPAPVASFYGVAGARSWLQERSDDLEPTYRVELTPGFFPWLRDHKLGDEVVFPGAGYVEAGLMLARQNDAAVPMLRDVRFLRLLTVAAQQASTLSIRYLPKLHGFQVFSNDTGGSCQLHCEGRIAHGLGAAPPPRNLAKLRAGTREVSAADKYAELAAAGLRYGPCFQSMQRLFVAERRVFVELAASSAALDPEVDSVLHPVLLDGALQALSSLVDFGAQAYVPSEVERIVAWRSAGERIWADVRLTALSRSHIVADVTLLDAEGNVCVELDQVTCSALAPADDQRTGDELYEPAWEAVTDLALGNAPGAGRFSLVVATDALPELRSQLKARAEHFRCYPSVDSMLKSGASWSDSTVVLVRSNTSPLRALELPEQLLEASVGTAGDLAALAGTALPLRVWLVTQGAVRTQREPAGHVAGLAGAALWSLLRVARNEHTQLSLAAVDLDPSESDWESVSQLLLQPGERELARRTGAHLEQRLRRVATTGQKPPIPVVTRTTNVALLQAVPGSLDSLGYKTISRREPGARECEVRTYETSLGFKDLLKLTGRINPRALEGTYWGHNVGMVATGTVERVGQEVTRVKPGDRVVFVCPDGAFRAYANTLESALVRLADELPLHEIGHVAAWTAHRALIEMARVRPGETVLVHNAAGAVGLYAVQIALHHDARVFATASTEDKRRVLLEQGVTAVYDSRFLDFAREVRAATSGRGIDVALGAVHGDALRETLQAMAVGGRYVEIGKRDIAENNSLPLGLFHNNLSYMALDVDGLLANHPESAWETARQAMAHFASGAYRPVATTSYPASAAADAIRAMADRTRIGPVAIRFEDQQVDAVSEPTIRGDGTYLVTGGLGGFGLEVATWLSAQGAGALVLCSRRGAADPLAQRRIADMEARGTQVRAVAVDVANADALSDVLGSVRATLPPVRGVFHAAMVLDDRPLLDMDPQAFERVFWPKVQGALNLHGALAGDPLELFVLFSSMAAQVGNPHQANYAAANAALDALAHERHAAGLCATSIDWGALGETGVVARNEALTALLRTSGIRGMSTSTALSTMDRVIRRGLTQAGAFDVDWGSWSQVFPRTAELPLFAGVAAGAGGADERGVEAARRLSSVPPAERPRTMLELLLDPIARVLRTPRDRIDDSSTLTSLGLDSLMATEAVILFEQVLGLKVSVALLLDGRPLRQLSSRLLEQFEAHVAKREKTFASAYAGSTDELAKFHSWVREMKQAETISS